MRVNKKVEGFLTGLHKSPFRGFSVEFADYRAYNSGESTKHVDWKLFARTDRLFIKNYEQETNLRCLLVIDNSASMNFPFDKKNISFDNPNKLVFSVEAASALTAMLYKQRDAFGLALFSNKIDFITDIKSNFAHKKYIFTLLQQLCERDKNDSPANTKLSPLLHQLSEQVHRRSLVIIFSDLLGSEDDEQELIKSLQHLRYNQHEVILFHTIDKKLEQEFLYSNRPYKFKDAETGEEYKLNPLEIRKEYQNRMREKFSKIRKACNNIRIDYVECDINKTLDQVLMPYFLKRIKLK